MPDKKFLQDMLLTIDRRGGIFFAKNVRKLGAYFYYLGVRLFGIFFYRRLVLRKKTIFNKKNIDEFDTQRRLCYA
jgi:hypothetical protein